MGQVLVGAIFIFFVTCLISDFRCNDATAKEVQQLAKAADKQMRQSARRIASMERCLYEAIRDKQRKFASEASTVGVAVDERKGHLLVTFRACAGLELAEVSRKTNIGVKILFLGGARSK